jgi:hypothetical protein
MYLGTSCEHSKYYTLFEISGTKIQNGSYHYVEGHKFHASATLRLNRYGLDLHTTAAEWLYDLYIRFNIQELPIFTVEYICVFCCFLILVSYGHHAKL